MRLRTIVVGIIVLAGAVAGAAYAALVLWPVPVSGTKPAIVDVPPLPPASGRSIIVVPTAIALTAIRDALEAVAPRALNGKLDTPLSKYVANPDVSWTAARGALAVYGKPEMLAATTALSGTLRATGKLSAEAAGNLSNAVGGLLGQDAARRVERLAGRPFDQRAEIRATIIVLSQPEITPAWRLEPKLTPQLTVTDAGLTIAGVRLSVANEVKPLLEQEVNALAARLQERLRNDPFIEQAARREWAKLCRAFPLAAAGTGLPNLWLELRPTRAIAAKPRVDAEAVTLLIGLEAETRIVPEQTQPDCPFPATLAIVPQADAGRVSVTIPIDIPFSEVNRLIAERIAGGVVPEDKRGALEVAVRSATVTPSGDNLIISLKVTARERTSWLGLASEGTVHIRGRPVLDGKNQVLRLADVALDLDPKGVLSPAIRAASPYLQRAVAERAAIDLKPYTGNVRASIEAAVKEFRGAGDGVQVEAAIADLRITAIAFDATTLRIVAEADGAAKVDVTKFSPR